MEKDEKLKQLLASAQQELNRLTTAQKNQSRKQITHRKIVLGGEVAKHMGLDIDQDVLVGYLIRFSALTEKDISVLKIRGAEARRLDSIRKDKSGKSNSKKRSPGKLSTQKNNDMDNTINTESEKVTKPDVEYNTQFFRMLKKGLTDKKEEND
ncbi:conjugal transfer protein TraD [Dickeya sp. DW 0440]|uniref:conjugal transfer protein TraD n=1 Tax=Dickeya sp. DW 0440 TaxID=1225785 RepID=UPI0003A8CA6E|nr:conjugal transfer protein TraD [Dickeya sp. DW 0440]